jgi:hypothetical protein
MCVFVYSLWLPWKTMEITGDDKERGETQMKPRKKNNNNKNPKQNAKLPDEGHVRAMSKGVYEERETLFCKFFFKKEREKSERLTFTIKRRGPFFFLYVSFRDHARPVSFGRGE